ncbi:MAG: two-component sensor histidine kinase [Proteobacteria bacterium]|nr:two-component sensor histidine kinase [Pseudomonadota bacterium]
MIIQKSPPASGAGEEKIKPFRLIKYFTLSSLIVIFIGTLALSLVNSQLIQTILLKKNEEYALLLAENLNHQVFLQFIIPVTLKYGKVQLRNPEQFERLDKVIRSTLHSFKIDNVNIYDLNNIISYSFSTNMVGEPNIGGTGYKNAVDGKASSNFVQKGRFIEILIGKPKESKMITFAPLRVEKPLAGLSGRVLGVVEIVQNTTDDFNMIFNIQQRIIMTCSAIMGALFVTLLFVVKRGENIIEKQNIEKFKLKEELNRAQHLSSLGEMTAGISHEIRNPLGIIISSAALLKKKVAKIDPTNMIPNIILEESERLNHIVTDFLNFARPKPPSMTRCSINEILEKNITFLQTTIEKNGYHISKEFDLNLPSAMADPNMLYQAFLNILINAMQAMPEGGKISVRAFSDNDSISIIFEDEGKGISESLIHKIWDPFFTTKEKGTGLGLGIVKNIIESHNGLIEIMNISPRGVRVSIKLPHKDQES